MNIVLQDIVSPIATREDRFKKIILTNGDTFYPHDIPQNEYHEIALHALGEKNILQSTWKIISENNNKKILEHVTRSRNILCTTADASSILHHSSFTLNSHSEIIPITSNIRARIMKEIKQLAEEGFSISGISIKKIDSKSSTTHDNHNGIFIALVLHEYSFLPNAQNIISEKIDSKNTIKIFSKELLPTCKWFARKIGVHASHDFCITSDQLQSMNDTELESLLDSTTVFAEMTPLDLERVSRLLTKQGHELFH